LNERADRVAVVIEMAVAPDGSVGANRVYRALVRNRAQLTYGAVGPWLEGKAAMPAKVAASAPLAAQLQLQNEAAHLLRAARDRMGALTFDRAELQAVVDDGKVRSVEGRRANTASRLIEDFMIARRVMAETLRAGVSVDTADREGAGTVASDVELAGHGASTPAEADAAALNAGAAQEADPVHFTDVSLAVLRLMGPGEYVAARPGVAVDGHFGLAAQDYTHSTAPNRRFADLVTQRLVKALVAGAEAPYTDDELEGIARNCTLKEDAARKVQRDDEADCGGGGRGRPIQAVVTGVTPKGVFVRERPPVEGG
jgi:exoribonuclease-2